MSIESAFNTRMDGYAGLVSLVATRNYALILPQGVTYPATVYTRQDAEFINSLASDAGVIDSRFSVIWHEIIETDNSKQAQSIGLALYEKDNPDFGAVDFLVSGEAGLKGCVDGTQALFRRRCFEAAA